MRMVSLVANSRNGKRGELSHSSDVNDACTCSVDLCVAPPTVVDV